jgi:PAS domain-containing protein
MKALEESRNLLQAVIDTAPMRVFWKDQDLRYLGCNPAFARDAGKTHPDELARQG